jgi:hemoglobin-like flavoprotein
MGMTNTGISGLDNFETVEPVVQNLGRRYVGYGVQDAPYDKVGEALRWTLKQGPEDDYTQEVETAWATPYGALADTMKAAAQELASDTGCLRAVSPISIEWDAEGMIET